MKKQSKSVNIALSSSAFISVYPPTSAVKKRLAQLKLPNLRMNKLITSRLNLLIRHPRIIGII